MTINEFKKLYFQKGKDSKTSALVGMIIGVVGCSTFLLMDYSITGVIAFGVLASLAALGYYMNIRHEASLARSNPLIQGIKSGNSDYIKWFYVTTLTHKKNIKALNFKTYYINAFNDKRKVLDLSMASEEQGNQAMDLFASKFPNAEKGYSDEIRLKMIEKYNYKNTDS